VRIDAVGNIFGWRAGLEDLPPVMTGSHIDTVATGGRYDGNYGVLAGLEVVRAQRRGATTRRPLVVAVFTNEEGARFQPDMLGSLVYAGGLSLAEALATRASTARRWATSCSASATWARRRCRWHRPHAFVELHIEQGPVLDAEGGLIGAVHNLQGISWQALTSPASPTTPAPRRCGCATTPATARRPSPASCASWRARWAAARWPPSAR
jgi:N-carbamoyl-L-amino-acid hydrolase